MRFQWLRNLWRCLFLAGCGDAAVAALEHGLDGLQQARGDYHAKTLEALHDLAALHAVLGHNAAAKEVYNRALKAHLLAGGYPDLNNASSLEILHGLGCVRFCI